MKTNIKNTIKFLIIIAVVLLICYSLSSCVVQRQPVYVEPQPRTVYYYPPTYYHPVPPHYYRPTPVHQHHPHKPVTPPKRGRH